MMTIEQFRSPELARLYSHRYVERLVDYHAAIFRSLIAAGEIRPDDPEALAMMYVAPVITLIGICDREPEREAECLEKLRAHTVAFLPRGACLKRGDRDDEDEKPLIQKLGLLGVVSLLSYTAAVVFSPLAYLGYDWMAQAVSDLSAADSSLMR